MTGRAQVRLRAAERGDIVALIDLLRRSWLRTWAPELPFAAVRVFVEQDPVTDYVRDHYAAFVLAVRDDAIVGMVHVAADRIESIEVDPRILRSGIGHVVLTHAEAHIGQSHSTARLEVRAFNHGAMAFYHGHGWVETARYPAIECGSSVDTIALSKVVNRTPAQAGA